MITWFNTSITCKYILQQRQRFYSEEEGFYSCLFKTDITCSILVLHFQDVQFFCLVLKCKNIFNLTMSSEFWLALHFALSVWRTTLSIWYLGPTSPLKISTFALLNCFAAAVSRVRNHAGSLGRKFRWKFGGVGLILPDEKGVVKKTTPTLNMDFIYFKNFVSVFCFFANSLVKSISDNIDTRLLACET